MTLPLYQLLGPTSWAIPPNFYNYSSLAVIERCPRQWQLTHSRYGELSRFPTRPHPAAVEGEVVHSVLDRLFKAMAIRGFPALGTSSFREGLVDVDIQGKVRHFLVEHECQLTDHPRANAFRLRTSPQQLVNQVIRLFRGLYQDIVSDPNHRTSRLPAAIPRTPQQIPSGLALEALLHERGALSELSLTHPTLPIGGMIDLVWSDKGKAVITDFKTGQEKPEHQKQVTFYAILWWRCSGVAPDRVEVRYPKRSVPIPLNEAVLVEVEAEMRQRVNAVTTKLKSIPAPFSLGELCQHCDVRQFCDGYWAHLTERFSSRSWVARPGTSLDVDLTIVGEPSDCGFDALVEGETDVFAVVFQASVALTHGPFVKGDRLRILRGQEIEGGAIELKTWTEVFHLGMV